MTADEPTEPTYDGVTIALRIEDVERVVTVIGVIDGEDVVLTVDGDDLSADGPLRRPVVELPLHIASLVGLGPRPAPAADPVVLVSDDDADPSRTGLLEGWSPEQVAGTCLQAGSDLVLWSVIVAWTDDTDELVGRALVVADGGDYGLATIEQRAGGLAVVPCTSTDVWTQLSSLLPRRFELGAVSP